MPASWRRRKSKLSKKTSAKYVIGIDLGTTNSALAYAEIPAGELDPFAPANVQLLPSAAVGQSR